MEAKVIKTQEQYHSVLQEAEKLVARDPAAGSKDADRLELLTVLVEDFEKKHFPLDAPDPVSAIEFRMSEQGLRQRDLLPLIGSRSRVSEVLARKRPLTVQMIRAISVGLGIPVETLVADTAKPIMETSTAGEAIDWGKFPVREMERRGWFSELKVKTRSSSEEMVKAFLAQIGMNNAAHAFYRRTFRGDEIDKKSYYSILAWTARVLIRAKPCEKSISKFDPSKITPVFFRELAQLSWFDQGPVLAIEFLEKCGIVLIVEPRLPNTLIDGAAMLTERGTPVIALTLRYDRIDYFWFTLLHELAHVWKHLNTVDEAFVDRLESIDSVNIKEKEANRISRNALIPRAIWKRSQAFLSPTNDNIRQLADNMHIHPAIVVGRLQHETGQYDRFREFLGAGSVRRAFPNVSFK